MTAAQLVAGVTAEQFTAGLAAGAPPPPWPCPRPSPSPSPRALARQRHRSSITASRARTAEQTPAWGCLTPFIRRSLSTRLSHSLTRLRVRPGAPLQHAPSCRRAPPQLLADPRPGPESISAETP
jgi:hypothetical protein